MLPLRELGRSGIKIPPVMLGGSPAQLAIAWVLKRPGIAAPMASATKLEQLEDLVKAATLKLDAPALADLEVAST